MKFLHQSLLAILLLVLVGCTATTQQTTDTTSGQDQEIYVFDDVGISDSTEVIIPEPEPVEIDTPVQIEEPEIPVDRFVVQVGAFTSNERATKFVNENQSKINWQMEISFSEKVQLFVVQLPPFPTRTEAEYVRNQLWQTATFKDAFIVPEEIN